MRMEIGFVCPEGHFKMSSFLLDEPRFAHLQRNRALWSESEQKGEAERKQRVVFRDQALGPVGRRVTAKCISRAANPLRKETATFFGPQSDTGTLFTGN